MTFFNAEAYERLMGRWSRRLAPLLIEFADVREGDRVLDVGSGTGSLALAVNAAHRSEVVGIDPSAAYVELARTRTADPRVRFDVGDAQVLPYPDASFDKCLALLVINFIPDARKAVAEMRRVTRPGGRVAARLWRRHDDVAYLLGRGRRPGPGCRTAPRTSHALLPEGPALRPLDRERHSGGRGNRPGNPDGLRLF